MVDIVPVQQVKNSDWARDAFFIPRLSTNASASIRQSYDSSMHKFYDTSVGGNRVMNPIPGLTPTADPRPDKIGGLDNPFWLKGQGSYYSEAYDDNQETLSLQYGVPKNNAMSTFFSNYYDPSVGRMVKSGGILDGAMFTAGKITGTLLTLPFQAFFGLNRMWDRLKSAATGAPYSKYYYMNPAMPLFWNTAQNIATAFATNMFMAPSLRTDDIVNTNASSNRYNANPEVLSEYAQLAAVMPDVFDANSGINIYAIATRSQRLANQHAESISRLADSGTLASFQSGLAKLNATTRLPETGNAGNFTAYMQSYIDKHPSAKTTAADEITPNLDNTLATDQPAVEESVVRKDDASFVDFFNAERKDGSAFVTFRTTKQEGGTDTFANSSKRSPLEEKLNGLASAAKDLSSTFSGGNVFDNPVADSVESLVGGVTSFLDGAASSIGLSVVGATASGAIVDMPEIYDASTTEVGSNSFNIKLHSPYGDKASIFMNIFVPLSLLLAGVLPRSTGKSSHMSPFLCRAHVPGKLDIKLGLIESLSLTKFTGNIGKSIDNLPTQIDVTITIKNLDAMITAPVSDSLFGDAIGFSAFDEDTAMTDYIAAMSGLSLFDQYYLSNRIDLAWSRTTAQWGTLTSAASMANYIGGTAPGRIISALSAPGVVTN